MKLFDDFYLLSSVVLSLSLWHTKTPHFLNSIPYCLTNGVQFKTDKLDEKADEWQEKARKLAAELGRQMVERAGNAAFVGHRVEVKTGGKKDEKKTVLYTAPKAYNSFLYNLRKLYPKKEGGTA